MAKTFGKSVIISNSIIKSDLKSENAIEFHLKRRKSQKKRPYRSIPNAIWTLFCLRKIQPENRTYTINRFSAVESEISFSPLEISP